MTPEQLERYKIRRRLWEKNNRQRINAYKKKWRDDHKDDVNLKARERNLRKGKTKSMRIVMPKPYNPKASKPILTEEELKAEVWMPVMGNENTHEVSNMGRIKNIKTNIISLGHMNGRYLGWRYDYIKELSIYMHRLVMNHFNPNTTLVGDITVHHKNENRYDNRLSNLEWIERAEHSRQHGKENNPLIGENSPYYKGHIALFTREGVLYTILKGKREIKNSEYCYNSIYNVLMGKRKTYKNMFVKRIPKEFDYTIGNKYDLNMFQPPHDPVRYKDRRKKT